VVVLLAWLFCVGAYALLQRQPQKFHYTHYKQQRNNTNTPPNKQIRSELAAKEIALLQKEAELAEREQTLAVLREELALERKLRALLTKDKEKARVVAGGVGV
jgi:flagellar motility protein MotE (MotC chaperone)